MSGVARIMKALETAAPPGDQTCQARTTRAAHIRARPDDLMTAGPLRDVTVVSGAVPGRARVNRQRAGMPALGGMLHG